MQYYQIYVIKSDGTFILELGNNFSIYVKM